MRKGLFESKSKSKPRRCKWYDLCPMKYFYEQGKIDKSWIEQYCFGDYTHCVRKRLEERHIPHPDNMMPDGSINKDLPSCIFEK